MSRYFEVLNRLAAESPAQPTYARRPDSDGYGPDTSRSTGNGTPAVSPHPGPAAAPSAARTAVPSTEPTAPPSTEPTAPPSAEPTAPPPRRARSHAPNRFTGVLERVHEVCGTLVGVAVVVAPVSSSESVSGTVVGIAEEAERAGLKTLAMTATPQGRGLALACYSRGGRNARLQTAVPGTLQRVVSWESADNAPRGIEQWLEEARGSFDFVVISVPMLASTPGSARLARACNGLVLVAQANVTQRRDLELAAERARIGECNVLGLVFAEPYNRLKELLGFR